jgi:hypothetical protein
MDYAYEDKIAAMELLRSNGFNISKTSAELRKRGINVCRQTLAAWRSNPDVGGAVFKEPEPVTSVELIAPTKPYSDAEVVQGRIYEFVREASFALSVAVREVKRRISEEKVSNSELCNFMTVLNEIANSPNQSDDVGSKASVLSLIVNMQNSDAEG